MVVKMDKSQGVRTGESSSNPELKLDKELVLTVYGSEHEDILLTISEILHRFKGTFLSNNFHRVGLQFTGLMKIAINHMYLKPFISCLDSLASYSVRFDTQIITNKQSDQINEQMRFEFEAWGADSSEFRLEFLKCLNRYRLVVESVQDSIKVGVNGEPQTSSRITVATDYVVDETELQEEVYQIGKSTGMTVLLLNQDLGEDGELGSFQEAI